MQNSAVTVLLFILVLASGGLVWWGMTEKGMSLSNISEIFDFKAEHGKDPRLKAFRVISFSVDPDYRDKRVGVVELQFDNRGEKTIPYPTLRFSLNKEQLVNGKKALVLLQESRLQPYQYLDKTIAIEKGMEPHQIVSYTFRFELPAQEIPRVRLKFEY